MLPKQVSGIRPAIIAAAAETFEKAGYGRTGLDRVAELAGISRPALDQHFPSKADLAKAVIDAQHRIVVADGLAVLQQDRPPLDSMIIMCREFGLRLRRDTVVRAGIRLTFEATAFGHRVREPYEDWSTVTASLANRAAAAGQLRPEIDPAALARLVVASFTGVQMVSDVLTGRGDVMDRIREMWQILLPGILNTEMQFQIPRLVALVRADGTAAVQG
ncbi:A-factor receptor protein [Arthrobacter crystallopoietes BAB-32]|uniref:A-factor receptor protein n=1 Tax=Arthrobacter crystallopoietes BAB-32 TaxID=1246476 RepID=N1V4H3_9MICC|nr:ScbR family autoregulator-binding transcription factor [Arthrobacter crystallopoietes]EMY36235.1 A-factor receptor protein [Arthrobacter crystallopoietes BAB-32]